MVIIGPKELVRVRGEVGPVLTANSAAAASANSAAIAAAILGGRTCHLPPLAAGGSTVYYISETINLVTAGSALGGVAGAGGGFYLSNKMVLRAAPGFVGPLIKIDPQSGDGGGLHVENVKLDGANVAGVTALVEYGDACYGDCTLRNVSGVNAPIGILTGADCENIVWDRVQMFIGIGIGVRYGSDNRFIMADKCRFGGTTGALLVGPDNAVSTDRCSNIVLRDSALTTMRDITAVGGTTPGPVAIVRNCWNFQALNCIFEYDGLIGASTTALVQFGTATAKPVNPTIFGGMLLGNNRVDCGVEIVNALYPNILYPQRSTVASGITVKNTMLLTGSPAGSGGIVLGGTVDDSSGLSVSFGGTGTTTNKWSTPFKAELAAGTIGFGVFNPGDTVARIGLDTVNGLSAGGGSTSPDATFHRTTNADWIGNKRIRANTGVTASRHATPIAGQIYFDTTLGKPIW
jgi:hypothetical protein